MGMAVTMELWRKTHVQSTCKDLFVEKWKHRRADNTHRQNRHDQLVDEQRICEQK